jgi:molybdenum cofactor cytidylyltransferase
MDVHIAGIILAAGSSSRMGSVNKLLMEYKGHTVIEETLLQLSNSMVDSILIVTGHENTLVEEILAGYLTNRIQSVFNGEYRLGRAESIKCAVRHLSEEAEAALFMVADKPGVPSGLINRAIERYRTDRPPILYVDTPYGRGHPIIFSRTLFGELLSLRGDRVGNEIVANYENVGIALNDDSKQIDIDDEADYHMLLREQAARQVTTTSEDNNRSRGPH